MKAIRAASAGFADRLSAPIGLRAALSRDFIKSISPSGAEVSFLSSNEIVTSPSPEAKVLCIRSGTIKILSTLLDGRQQIVDFLTTGDLFIKASSDGFGERLAVAISEVRAVELSLQDLLQALKKRDDLREEFFTSLIAAVDCKSRHISTLGRMRSEERVAYFLLDLSKQTNSALVHDGTLQLPQYRSEIADYLGLTTETVSRVFTALRDQGLIRLTAPNHVVIEDAKKLALIASGGANMTVK